MVLKVCFKPRRKPTLDLRRNLKPLSLTPRDWTPPLAWQVGEDDHDSLWPSRSDRGGGAGSAEAAPGHLGLRATQLFFCLPCLPKFFFSAKLRRRPFPGLSKWSRRTWSFCPPILKSETPHLGKCFVCSLSRRVTFRLSNPSERFRVL